MNLLLVLAILATGLALGGVAIARYETNSRIILSLIRGDYINDEAEHDDWACERWWELTR